MFLNIVETFELMERFFPGLVVLDEHTSIVMRDKSIGECSLEIMVERDTLQVIYSITMYGSNFWIKLTAMETLSYGSLYMDRDFGLSLESCAGLYEHDIEIYYVRKDTMDYGSYERQSIMRQHTIKNILK